MLREKIIHDGRKLAALARGLPVVSCRRLRRKPRYWRHRNYRKAQQFSWGLQKLGWDLFFAGELPLVPKDSRLLNFLTHDAVRPVLSHVKYDRKMKGILTSSVLFIDQMRQAYALMHNWIKTPIPLVAGWRFKNRNQAGFTPTWFRARTGITVNAMMSVVGRSNVPRLHPRK